MTYCNGTQSNAAYAAVNQTLSDVKNNRSQAIPMHLRDPRSSGYNPEEGDYIYPHNSDEAYVKQEYLGVETEYYQPVNRGYETKIRERMDYWKSSEIRMTEKATLRAEIREELHSFNREDLSLIPSLLNSVTDFSGKSVALYLADKHEIDLLQLFQIEIVFTSLFELSGLYDFSLWSGNKLDLRFRPYKIRPRVSGT